MVLFYSERQIPSALSKIIFSLSRTSKNLLSPNIPCQDLFTSSGTLSFSLPLQFTFFVYLSSIYPLTLSLSYFFIFLKNGTTRNRGGVVIIQYLIMSYYQLCVTTSKEWTLLYIQCTVHLQCTTFSLVAPTEWFNYIQRLNPYKLQITNIFRYSLLELANIESANVELQHSVQKGYNNVG
jgi:hypothetical protein